ncbi:MAG TPA: pitrilysin family protein [Polyangiaceae bacterium]|nr:pitrilysin family protein [Polyangiaceae bacterium]
MQEATSDPPPSSAQPSSAGAPRDSERASNSARGAGVRNAKLLARQKLLSSVNAKAPEFGKVEHVETLPFGPNLRVERFRFSNGLQLLLCEDHSAPVLAYHTWYRVGSRHERVGKTGLAHLFEHLMFNEVEGRPAGEFDRLLEEAGSEVNASTWLDWTQYNAATPRDQLGLVVQLESERMSKLVLREPQVTSEKEVVANERRYRVEDDVEGSVSELLWATAYKEHAYRWPTIGWMEDIQNFTTADCEEFYKTYYAPNNATIVVVGDVTESQLLPKLSRCYGVIAPSVIPLEDVRPEPPQLEERRCEVQKPTSTEKLVMGYHAPALGDYDHGILSLLIEVLFGGRASRLHQLLVRELELVSEVRAFIGPFKDPGLVEIFASCREGHRAEEILERIDAELTRVMEQPIAEEEIERGRTRFELSLLSGLDTMDGKASTLGFYDAVLGTPNVAFERLELIRRTGASELRRVARKYFDKRARSIIFVRPAPEGSNSSPAGDAT